VQLATLPFPEDWCVGVGEEIKDIQIYKRCTGQLKGHQVYFFPLCALNLVLPLSLVLSSIVLRDIFFALGTHESTMESQEVFRISPKL